ncbi:MAG: hypothetical protein ACUVXF_11530 [Desulfobaccales bacterium]
MDPYVLDAYLNSPEARHLSQKYNLYRPFHYNIGLPGQEIVFSGINSEESLGFIGGKNVSVFRCPCLHAITNQSLDRVEIKIDLKLPKQEIMNMFEKVLNDALRERDKIGKKIKKRGIEVGLQPFKIWDMHYKNGMTTWEITKELFPEIKDKSYADWDDNYSPQARSYLRKVERALRKANDLISSITPTS